LILPTEITIALFMHKQKKLGHAPSSSWPFLEQKHHIPGLSGSRIADLFGF
jgi:hypothetical protein